MYREVDTFSEIRKRILRRLGHLDRMPEAITVEEVFKNIKKVKVRWRTKKKNDWMMLKMIWRKWILDRRKIVSDKDAWKLNLKLISVLRGSYSQCRVIVLLLLLVVVLVVVVVVVAISSSSSLQCNYQYNPHHLKVFVVHLILWLSNKVQPTQIWSVFIFDSCTFARASRKMSFMENCCLCFH